jgi:hypothetical protein
MSNSAITSLSLPEDFSSERKHHRSRSYTLVVNMVDYLQDLVNQDPGRSMRFLARELDISKKSVRNRMQQDICYKLYAMRRGQFMNQATKREATGQGQAPAQRA